MLELSESSIPESEVIGIDAMAAIRQIGVRIAIDDFGTGHSSLSRLKLLPISELKIDRSFIRDIAEDTNDAAIVQAILALSATLGLEVIAEGVEHPGQRDFLLQHGCLRAHCRSPIWCRCSACGCRPLSSAAGFRRAGCAPRPAARP